MKLKELFQRILNKDGYVIHRNTGIISFDEKSNFIKTGQSESYIFIPEDIMRELGTLNENPFIDKDNNGNVRLITYIIGSSIPSSSDVLIDEFNVNYPEDEDVFSVYSIPIDEEIISYMHELGINYFDDKIGKIIITFVCIVYEKEGFIPLSPGTHTCKILVDNVKLYDEEFEIE